MEKNSQKVTELPSNVWLAESLRFTGFPSPTAEYSEPTWWENLVGENPERRVSQPKTNTMLEQGNFGDNQLVLSLNPLRIDWRLVPREASGSEMQTIPTIGSFSDSLPRFLKLINRWIQEGMCPQLKRMAFGAILFFPVNDRLSGYEAISKYLASVKLVGATSTDFLYQINRPRNSKSNVPNLIINRLSRWSVMAVQGALMGIRPGMVEARFGSESSACRLELDINTDAKFSGSLPDELRFAIMEELTSLAVEIAEKGDIE
jgi:hypothetical protein